MITETGKVVALKGSQAWVRTIRASACQSCSARSGCGQKVLASASGGRANQVLVDNAIGADVGDEVTLGIDEQALLGASVMVYAWPLLLMVTGSLCGHYLAGGGDAGAVAGAVAGLAGGFLTCRNYQSRNAGSYQPRLLRVNRIPSVSCL